MGIQTRVGGPSRRLCLGAQLWRADRETLGALGVEGTRRGLHGAARDGPILPAPHPGLLPLAFRKKRRQPQRGFERYSP